MQELQCLRAENAELSHHLEEVLTSNEALRKGSTLLQEKSEALLEELSIKEAEWSQKEDRLKEEVYKFEIVQISVMVPHAHCRFGVSGVNAIMNG